jgi:predicted DNA-binding transcriptional regulator YafY
MVPSAAERILRLAAYLEAHERDVITLDEIRRDVAGYDDATTGSKTECEAARKKLQRDIRDLDTGWGIKVVYHEANHRYHLAPPFLSARERAALISAAAVVTVEGLQALEPGAIGSGVDDAAARVVVQVHALVASLRDAISARTPLRFGYEGRERVIEPWALGVWRNKWYVAGGDPTRDRVMRRFRLDRVDTTVDPPLAAAGEPGSYDLPHWFDLDKAFDFDPNSWGADPPLDARIRVERDHALAFATEFGGEETERDAHHAWLALTVRHYESFVNRLLGFRGHAVVEGPPELVTRVRDHLAATAGVA